MLDRLRHLWDHVFWADAKLLNAIRASTGAVPEALREYAHIIGTEETWLARIQQRSPRSAIWPDGSIVDMQTLRDETEAAYKAYLAGLREVDLSAAVTYTNSAGQAFTNTVSDILMHVVLHGQYHRGKVNLLLRQAGQTPAATDYIAYVRGVPAATEAAPHREPHE